MKITDVKLYRISIPLRVPFKTALRSVDSVEDVIVEIITDTGERGFGEAPPTGVITGDTTGAIVGAIRDHIAKSIIGMDIDALEDVLQTIQRCIVHNTSAKAAVDMAVWDLYGKLYRIPVHKLLGGARKEITTDITISVNPPEQMAADTLDAIRRGYDCLKVKVGVSPELDVARLSAVRKAAGDDVLIRIDANQAWTPKQAVRILNEMQEKGLKIELVEQPVKAADIEGLKYVEGTDPYAAESGIGFVPDPIIRSLGVPLVTGDIPGVAVVLGKADDPADVAKVVKDYQSKGIMTFIIGDAIEQCAEGGVKMGLEFRVVPLGHDVTAVIHVVTVAIRAA
ncbi:MAG: dipeptide epimerase, partial [Lachnospiraceae bacterium]|nr:dipeptide epimerase [Lachnospiraceae bacterium]